MNAVKEEGSSDESRGSTRLNEPGFAGLLEHHIPEVPILWSNDGDLQTRGLNTDGFGKCAFALTPTRLWAFRGTGLMGQKKPLSVALDDIEKVGRLPRLGQPKSYLGIDFVTGALMMRGGAGKQEASRIGGWALRFDDDAVRDSCGVALTAQRGKL